MNKNLIFHQLFEAETSTYTYILGDAVSKEAIIIDSVLETADRDEKLLNELGLKLKYILDTHIHADHITGASELRKRFSAKTAVSAEANVQCVDIPLEDGQELSFGPFKVKALATPGHTNTCMSFYTDGMVFSGDALLIRGTGRTDFQQGSNENLFNSVHQKLYTMPDETVVYPGHDYRGILSSTIGLEKKFNPRVGLDKSFADFKKIMAELKLAHPRKIHEAVPANLLCGAQVSALKFHPQLVDGVPEISTSDLKAKGGDGVLLIDVRMPEEFVGELGHIENSVLVTLGPDLDLYLKSLDKKQEIVFICRSGNRSGTATVQAKSLGFEHCMNMTGGMIHWNKLGFKVIRS